MKIALLVPGGVDRSGEVRVIPALLALIKQLAARHELHVFALRQEERPGQWMLHGAQVHNIGGRAGPGRVLRAVAAVRREHRRAPFEIIHAVWSGGPGLAAVLAARLLGLPSLVHVAGGELSALPPIGYGGRLQWRGRLREALVLRWATAFSAASEPILEQLRRLGRCGERIPLGVHLEAWPPRPPAPRDTSQPLRLIHVASLNRVKDQATLLQALALLQAEGQDFLLDLVGEDTLAGSVQALASQLGLARRMRFHGLMTQQQLRPLFEQAQIHLVSSLHEAGPLVLLEAGVLGIPTVGTAVGHVAEFAPEAAVAVPVGDAQVLAAAISRLAHDEGLRQRLAVQAQRLSLQQDAAHTALAFERLYQRLHGGPLHR